MIVERSLLMPITMRVQFTDSPARVMEHFLDHRLLLRWWGVTTCLVERRHGGLWWLAWETRFGVHHALTGVIGAYTAARSLCVEKLVCFNSVLGPYGPTELAIAVVPNQEGTELVLEHSGFRADARSREFRQRMDGSWRATLRKLRKDIG